MKKIVFSIALTAVCSVVMFAQTDQQKAKRAAKIAQHQQEMAQLAAAEEAAKTPASVVMAPQVARPSLAEIQQKSDAAAALFIARYKLDAKQAEQIKSIYFAMTEKLASQIDAQGNINPATVTLLKTSCIDNMANCMTAPQRKQLAADYQAGMYK